MPRKSLSNADLAELLAIEADSAKSPMAAKALRKASRRAIPIQAA